MSDAVADLIGELHALRKGRGLYVTQIRDRLGPALRAAFEVDERLSAPDIRTRIADQFRALAEELPGDLRIAVLAALGIEPEARLPFYGERVRWVAKKLERDERTAQRRIDAGMVQLAQLASARRGPVEGSERPLPAIGWHTKELRVALVLDGSAPEAFVYRQIVAERDELETVDLAITLTNPREHSNPRADDDLLAQLLFGGTLTRIEKESSDRFGLAIRLPLPLARHETHTFALRTGIPQGHPMEPHYVCVPTHRCDLFELRIRFGSDTPPKTICCLDDVFQRDIDDPAVGSEQLSLDPAGELRLVFHHLNTGRAYGARWEY